jgi:hypothetical protein
LAPNKEESGLSRAHATPLLPTHSSIIELVPLTHQPFSFTIAATPSAAWIFKSLTIPQDLQHPPPKERALFR